MQRLFTRREREPQGGSTLGWNLAFVTALFVLAYMILEMASAVQGGVL